jgi:hypothetical protein
MKLGKRSIKVATLAFVLMGASNVSPSVVASAGVVASGTDGSFCSRPTIRVEAVPPPFKARLGISKPSVRPGGRLRVRIEDLGTEDLAYGVAYGLARREGGSWVKQPTGPFFAPRLVVPAGTAGACQAIHILSHAVAGLYRISKKVGPASGGPSKQVAVRATFRIRAATS